ncbi:MAG TPA: hypothetical protein VI564_00760 [Candidatus Nanoarchaeia archaeon]|nr:hypothetical protein [Candidatus Nanoarchaeia archaeon]
MELSNEFIEGLYFRQMKELTISTNRKLRSLDLKSSGIKARR